MTESIVSTQTIGNKEIYIQQNFAVRKISPFKPQCGSSLFFAREKDST